MLVEPVTEEFTTAVLAIILVPAALFGILCIACILGIMARLGHRSEIFSCPVYAQNYLSL